MTPPSLSSDRLHASCVAINGRAVLITGPSGSGKSDLALRLIDRGADLVSDDYTLVRRVGRQLVATAPDKIAGMIEIRGLGLIRLPAIADVPVCLFADLGRPVERMPEANEHVTIAGLPLPIIAVCALEASAPVKVEMALFQFGLKIS